MESSTDVNTDRHTTVRNTATFKGIADYRPICQMCPYGWMATGSIPSEESFPQDVIEIQIRKVH